MNNLQAMVDGWNAQAQKERSLEQKTLGALIDNLENIGGEVMIEGLCAPHSYRGYYCDLAFERGERKTIAETLAMLRGCLGESYEGYKGGDFYMNKGTPIWIADYGCTGVKIMSITGSAHDGITFITAEDTI